MADKKISLAQAVGKLKNAKKNVSAGQDENTKGVKQNNSKGNELTGKIKDAVSKFDRD